MARMSSNSFQSSSVSYETRRVQLTLEEALKYVADGRMSPLEFLVQLPKEVTEAIEKRSETGFRKSFRSLSPVEQKTVLIQAFSGRASSSKLKTGIVLGFSGLMIGLFLAGFLWAASWALNWAFGWNIGRAMTTSPGWWFGCPLGLAVLAIIIGIWRRR